MYKIFYRKGELGMQYVPPELRYLYLKEQQQFELEKIQKLIELKKERKNKKRSVRL